jgi:phosphoribosylaminoimidazole carboxylase PurE protein
LSELADVHLGHAPAVHGSHALNLHFTDERAHPVTGPAPARVGIVVGSRSDIGAAEKASAILAELGVPSEVRVISAHRAPYLLAHFASTADERGIRVFIAIAGLAAHLPGVLAAQTNAPVIGVPMAGGVADGLDALLAIVQMPKGVPVATVGVGNGENAALLAAQMLALSDTGLRARLEERRRAQAEAIAGDPANEGL